MVEAESSRQECVQAAGICYVVDELYFMDLQVLVDTSASYYSQILQQDESSTKFFTDQRGEKIKIDGSSLVKIPLYRDDNCGSVLALVNPNKKKTVLAVYLNGRWWPVDEVLKSSDPSKVGLKQVQTFRERVILFVLNCLVFGILEDDASEDGVNFLAHAAEEQAKILWLEGEAVAFYTYKTRGSLCNSSSQCYLLPVLDTMFVRKTRRRRGLGTQMLQDFCQSFRREAALGVSCPISAAMYQVCGKFLMDHPEERDRLWEVEAPGDWSQRLNIWLRIQLGDTPKIRECAADNKAMNPDKEGSQLERRTQGHPDGQDSVLSESNDDWLAIQLDRKRKGNQTEIEEEANTKKRKS
ncbi:protein FAM169B-like [Discoglossus pictus]